MNNLCAAATSERLAVLAILLMVRGFCVGGICQRLTACDEVGIRSFPCEVDMQDAGLQNCWQVSDRVYSGAGPSGPKSFEHLAALGFQAVVSVDGMAPDVEAARAAGLRYIHIPIGYGSISNSAQRQIMSVSEDVKGKIYVHCHHGKHRGPSAAAVLCMFEDNRKPETAIEILRRAGTSKSYAGLWKSVEDFDRKVIAAENAMPLVAVARVPPTASTMVEINRHFAQLQELVESSEDGAKVRKRVRELSVLAGELFHELSRTTKADRKVDIRQRYDDVGKLFDAMPNLPASGELTDRQFVEAVAAQTRRIGNACQACHAAHRN